MFRGGLNISYLREREEDAFKVLHSALLLREEKYDRGRLTGRTCAQKNDQTSADLLTILASSSVSNLALRVSIPLAANSRKSDARTGTIRDG